MFEKVYLIAISIILLSCSKSASEKNVEAQGVLYAEKFDIRNDTLIIKEPWPGAVSPLKYYFDEPPEKIIVTSTTHLPFLEILGVEESLVGFPSTKYISSPTFRKRVASALIKDLGPEGNLNLELLLKLDPDLIIAFDMGQESSTIDKIKEAGIEVVYNSDYLETSTLGRAEWIKLFGYLFDKEKKADSIFLKIKYNYDSLKRITENVENKPTVFSGVMYGDVWFLPGGKNWSAQFFEDSGADYLWSDNNSSGWLEVSFESVFSKAATADYWVGTSTFKTLEGLAGQDSRYADFEAYKNQSVYNYSKRVSPSGGFDYLESGYARPDIVLADMIRIFHPELLPDHEFYYFEKIR